MLCVLARARAERERRSDLLHLDGHACDYSVASSNFEVSVARTRGPSVSVRMMRRRWMGSWSTPVHIHTTCLASAKGAASLAKYARAIVFCQSMIPLAVGSLRCCFHLVTPLSCSAHVLVFLHLFQFLCQCPCASRFLEMWCCLSAAGKVRKSIASLNRSMCLCRAGTGAPRAAARCFWQQGQTPTCTCSR